MPIIQVINSFLDNDYISFLLYHKEEKRKVKVSLLGSYTLSEQFHKLYFLWYSMDSRIRCLASKFLFYH